MDNMILKGPNHRRKSWALCLSLIYFLRPVYLVLLVVWRFPKKTERQNSIRSLGAGFLWLETRVTRPWVPSYSG